MIKDLLTPEKIKQIKENPFFEVFFEDINRFIEENKQNPCPDLLYSDYRLFEVTGDRRQFETPYYIRRRMLTAYAIRYIFYRNPEDLVALQNVIWETCSEFSWALPAHIANDKENINPRCARIYIDLYSAETAASIAEIYSILKDEFEPRINERILYELNDRIIDSFAGKHYFFEAGANNWAGVCCGSVGMTLLYIAPDKADMFLNRLQSALAAYLSTFGEGGICEEGISYWNYGFSNYIYFADMLKEYSKGEINILNIPRAETIATFGCNAYIRKNHTISYSDGSHTFKYNIGLNHFLSSVYEKVNPLDPAFASKTLSNFFKDAIRTLLWTNTDYLDTKEQSLVVSEEFDKKLCWYINKKEKYAFTAKGGNNEESHNHNDLGNFIIFTDNGQQIIDFGAGYYNKNYFRIPQRYEEQIIACSRGHNVPVINGVVQQHGKIYTATATAYSDDHFVLDLSKAYPECNMSSYNREFILDDNSIKIKDELSFTADKNTVNEHFISFVKPKSDGNKVTIGDVTLICPEDGKINIITESVRNHLFREELQNFITIYITEVVFECNKELKAEFEVVIN